MLTGVGSFLLVSIREDATWLISRLDYDNETDCLVHVGLLFPVMKSQYHSPQLSKLTTCFESTQAMFQNGEFSKYAFLYMALPFARGVPARPEYNML